MTELEPELKSLLQRAKSDLSPSSNDEARLAARLDGARLAAETHLPSVKPWALGLGGLAIGLGLGMALGLHLESAVPPPELDAQPVSAAPAENIHPLVPPQSPTPTLDVALDLATAAPSNQSAKATTPKPDLTQGTKLERQRMAAAKDAGGNLNESNPNENNIDETDHVRRVRRALAQHDASLALLLLDELDRNVPNGRLMQERDAGRAIARCLQEPRRRAATRAAFERRHPSSVHQTRVAQACKQ